MKKPGTLDSFDRAGVAVLTILGTGIGLIMAVASDVTIGSEYTHWIPFRPIVIVMVPGFAVGYLASKLFGFTAAVVLTALANGAAYGLLRYAWDRLANKLAGVLRTMKPWQR